MTRDEQLMVIAMEECDEVSQRISKALRFGGEQVQPGQDLNNRQRILFEFSHLVAALQMLGFFPLGMTSAMEPWIEAKKEKVEKFLRYSEKICGTVSAHDPIGTPSAQE